MKCLDSCYDYASIGRHARLVVDTRNATHAVTEQKGKIVRCWGLSGMRYGARSAPKQGERLALPRRR